MPYYDAVVTSIGLELEARDLTRTQVNSILDRNLNARVIQDGSVRNHKDVVLGNPLINIANNSTRTHLMKMNAIRPTELGCEIVSPILHTTNKGWDRFIFEALDAFNSLGEGIASQTGIHVDVNAKGLPIDVLHNVIRLWQRIEAGMFRLSAGPLGQFRGALHRDSHFCRPLVENGPLVVQCADGQCRTAYSVDGLLNAETIEEFFKALGNCREWDDFHYHAPRYSAISFHSLYRLGSIEFRTFNASMSPAHVMAYIDISKAIIRNAMDKHCNLDFDLHPYGSKDMALEELVNILRLQDDRLIYAVEELWNMGSFPGPLHGYRYTHIKRQMGKYGFGHIRKALQPEAIDLDKHEIFDSESLQNDDGVGEIPGMIPLRVLSHSIGKSMVNYRRKEN